MTNLVVISRQSGMLATNSSSLREKLRRERLYDWNPSGMDSARFNDSQWDIDVVIVPLENFSEAERIDLLSAKSGDVPFPHGCFHTREDASGARATLTKGEDLLLPFEKIHKRALARLQSKRSEEIMVFRRACRRMAVHLKAVGGKKPSRITFGKGTCSCEVPESAVAYCGSSESSCVIFFSRHGEVVGAYESWSDGRYCGCSAMSSDDIPIFTTPGALRSFALSSGEIAIKAIFGCGG